MKTVRCLGLAVLMTPALAPAQPWTTVELKPTLRLDELIVGLERTPAAADLAVIDAVADAAGAAEVTPSLGDPLSFLMRLTSGVKLGKANRAVQSFSFDEFPGWSLRYVQPNYIYTLPELPPPVRRVFNLSARAEVGAGDSVTIGGIVVPGGFPRLVVFKVRGPSLADYNVAGTLSNPRMTLFDGDTPVLSNDDWTALRDWEKHLAIWLCPPPDDECESMIVTWLDPGPYTAIVNAPAGQSGVVLLEMYLEDAFYVP